MDMGIPSRLPDKADVLEEEEEEDVDGDGSEAERFISRKETLGYSSKEILFVK